MTEKRDDIQQILSLTDPTNMRRVLASYVNDLILSDFNRLVQLLYRLDIDELRLKELLSAERGKDAGELIADLILERQLQKKKSREHFSQRDDNINDEEKW